MKKTVITQIIERLEDSQKHIIANTDYAIGYDGALSDAVTVCKSFLKSEKEQIIEAVQHGLWNNEVVDMAYYSKIYYDSSFGDKVEEAGI